MRVPRLIKNPILTRLDARYGGFADNEVIEDLEARISDLSDQLDAYGDMRAEVDEALRLVNECADAIERLLVAEVAINQRIDTWDTAVEV